MMVSKYQGGTRKQLFNSLVTVSMVAFISNFLMSSQILLQAHKDAILVTYMHQFRTNGVAPSRTKGSHGAQSDSIDEEAVRAKLNGLIGNTKIRGIQDEQAIPNPSPSLGHNSFSACLLVMDDGHRREFPRPY
jgi:hypothetical protein